MVLYPIAHRKPNKTQTSISTDTSQGGFWDHHVQKNLLGLGILLVLAPAQIVRVWRACYNIYSKPDLSSPDLLPASLIKRADTLPVLG